MTDPTEQGWLRHVEPVGEDVSGLKLKAQPRFLHLWFSHPALEQVECDAVSFLGEAGQPIRLGGTRPIRTKEWREVVLPGS